VLLLLLSLFSLFLFLGALKFGLNFLSSLVFSSSSGRNAHACIREKVFLDHRLSLTQLLCINFVFLEIDSIF